MGTSRNWLGAMSRVDHQRLVDSVTAARLKRTSKPEAVPANWPRPPSRRHPDHAPIRALLAALSPANDPHHPRHWAQRHVERELATPRVREIYWRIRRAMWTWPEFAPLRPGARSVLEVVIELAREEAFPWYLPVPAHEVRRLARLSEGRFATSVRELECLAITRPAQRLEPPGDFILLRADQLRPRDDEPARPRAQWVVRYRRGIPWNAKRAAWWLNYDLLCETGNLLPCFEVGVMTLSQPYVARNHHQGPRVARRDAVPDFAAMIRWLSQRGPLPSPGFRAAIWDGLNVEGIAPSPPI